MNLFQKEWFRRRLFSLVLFLLTAVLSFGFVSKAVEYCSVRQELMRLSDSYRPIGYLTSDAENNDVTAGAARIMESPYVETADCRTSLWGTLTGLYNADLQGWAENDWRTLLGVNNSEVLFWGTLRHIDGEWTERPRWAESRQESACRLIFTVSERLLGYPDYAPDGQDVNVIYTYATAAEEGYELPELHVGDTYLVRAFYSLDRNGNWPGYEQWARAAAGHALTPLTVRGHSLFLTEAEGRAALPELLEGRAQFDELNRHSMNVIATKDMSAMPSAQDSAKRLYLTEGRWLDAADSNTGAMVCVIDEEFAMARNLGLGDSLELTFRDARPVYGYAYQEKDAANWQDYAAATRQYTVVGIYNSVPLNEYIHDFSVDNNNLYLPYGSVPAEYIRTDDPVYSPSFSFVLRRPQDADAFISDMREPLAGLGIQIQLIENDWEGFAESSNAMERTTRSGILVFLTVMTAGFVLLALLYVRRNRKSFAIARALGVPGGRCFRMCLSPMICISISGVSVGAVFSWNYALKKAGQMLTGIQEHGETTLHVTWLALFILIPCTLLTAITAAGILFMARRPVIELFYDSSGRRKSSRAPIAADSQAAGTHISISADLVTAADSRTYSPSGTAHGRGIVVTCRFVLCHIRRTAVRSLLVIAVTAAFLTAFAWIQRSIVRDTAEAEQVYLNTKVTCDLMKQNPEEILPDYGGAFITQDMADWLAESDYIQELYAEAGGAVTVRHVVIRQSTGEILTDQLIGRQIPFRGISDIDRFAPGQHIGIDYAEGYGPKLWETDWRSDLDRDMLAQGAPIVIPETWLEKYDLKCGMNLQVRFDGGVTTWLTIAGVYRSKDYGDGIYVSVGDTVLIPLSAVNVILKDGNRLYSAVSFSIDPLFNRRLGAVRDEINSQLQKSGRTLQRASLMLWDSELRQVAEPFEQNLEFMKLIFPVTVAVSVAAGGGLLFLLLMQRAEEAALLRVLGNSAGRTRRMLFAEPFLLCLLGIALGIGAVFHGFSEIPLGQFFFCAGIYAAGCTVGALAGSLLITRKMPLELLQVKE